MPSPPTLLITGATGTVGARAVEATLERGASVRAACRHPEQLRERFGGRVEAVALDYADASTFAAATDGADAVFLIAPPVTPNLAELMGPFVEHLRAEGPQRVVYLSAYGAEQLPEYRPVLDMVTASDFDLTLLEPGFFATNYGTYDREGIEQRNVIYQAAGDGRTAYVNPEDIARVAAAVLTEDGHAGQTYRLTGPETNGIAEIAAMLSEVRGVPTQYVAASPEEFRATLAASGAPPFIAEYMLPLYRLIREGEVAEVTGDVARLTGREPMRLREQLERDFGGGGG